MVVINLGKPGEHLKNNTMEINNDNNINNINNLDLKERSEPWARRCLDGLCGHVGDVLCAKRIAEDGWHDSVEEDRLLTPEEYNELAPSIAEEFVNRWVKNRGNRVLERMMAEMLRAEAKYLVKAWDEWQKRGANAGPNCDQCGNARTGIGGRVCNMCDLAIVRNHVICHCCVDREDEDEDEDYDDGNQPPRWKDAVRRSHDDGFDEYEEEDEETASQEEERRQEMAENAERQMEKEKEKFD